MPIGDAVDVTGIILADGWRTNLYVEGGGWWELDLPFRYRKLLGHRARVRGKRSGFNLIDVKKVERI